MNTLNISYTSVEQSHRTIIAHVEHQRKLNPLYSVIDLGGSAYSWTDHIRDHLVDIQAEDGVDTTRMDLCRREDWHRLLDLVDRRGSLFDYAICTHTLEDLYNPYTALELLPRIARSGVITMPSLRCETAAAESTNGVFFGYLHHHWIWDRNARGEILVIPKWPVVEALARAEFAHVNNTHVDTVMYEWAGDHIAHERFVDRAYPNSQEFVNGLRAQFNTYRDPRGGLKRL